MTSPARSRHVLLRAPALIACTGKYHGLGNRMRVVLGALALARMENRKFGYVWPVGRDFGARLTELWDFGPPTVPPVVSRLLSLHFPYRDHSLRWLDEENRRERLWQIRTPHALALPPGCPAWEDELRALVPAKPVTAGILEAYARGPAGRPFVGVMIRTNANAHSETLMRSPLQWYLTRMQEIRAIWPDVPFYVSADTTEAFRTVTQRFSSCYGVPDKGRYNSKQALVASVVDLYLLATASHLLGPHYSSFPELAQLLAGPQLRLETSMTEPAMALSDRQDITAASDPLRPFARLPLTYHGH